MSRRFGWHSGKVTAKEAKINGATDIGSLELLKASRTLVDSSSVSAATASGNEVVIGVDTNSQAVTVTLPTSMNEEGRMVVINDEGGNAGANAVTIATEGGSESIDGSGTNSLGTNYGTVKLYSDGSNWFTY